MSVSSEISRLTTLRNSIRSKLIGLGILSDSSATLSDCYTGIDGVTAQAATTYNVSSSDQTVLSGTYLSGDITIRGVTTSGISAGSILSGTTVKVGDSASAGRIADVSGTYVPYLEFTSVSVATTDYTTDSTYTDYPSRAAIACNGATADMFPYVEFSSNDAASGYFNNAATSYAGGVYIYALEPKAVTISKIVFYKRG